MELALLAFRMLGQPLEIY